jgi:hypothetical protein
MKLGLQNYALIPIENSCVKFNNKVNSLQRCNTAQHYRILHKVVQCLSKHTVHLLHEYCEQ